MILMNPQYNSFKLERAKNFIIVSKNSLMHLTQWKIWQTLQSQTPVFTLQRKYEATISRILVIETKLQANSKASQSDANEAQTEFEFF
jgi:hypothetical protein